MGIALLWQVVDWPAIKKTAIPDLVLYYHLYFTSLYYRYSKSLDFLGPSATHEKATRKFNKCHHINMHVLIFQMVRASDNDRNTVQLCDFGHVPAL